MVNDEELNSNNNGKTRRVSKNKTRQKKQQKIK